jgi:hypothetical protein
MAEPIEHSFTPQTSVRLLTFYCCAVFIILPQQELYTFSMICFNTLYYFMTPVSSTMNTHTS